MDEYPDIGPSVPMPALGPQDMGLPPAPVAPVRPVVGAPPAHDLKSRILKLVALGVAGGLGPGAGTGVLQGLQQADQRTRQDQQQKDLIARQTYQQQQTDYEQQQRIFESESQKRQQLLTQNLAALRQIAPKVKSKDEYEQYVQAYANGLQSMGFRINANFLRSAAPYVAPSAKDRAQKVFDAFLKNPVNKHLIETSPDAIADLKLPMDRDGDGELEDVPIQDIAAMADMPFATKDGQLFVYPKGTPAESKANADGIYEDLLGQAQAEGKRITPTLRNTLRQQAIRMAADAKPDTTDPTLKALRDIQLQNAQSAANGPRTLPSPIQRQVDTLAKGFDAQPAVKNAQMMSESVSFAQSLNPNTINPADDQGLIYAFAKAMDPNSVVREGEYATVQKYAQSWAQSYGFSVSRLFSNTPFLTPEARANMKATILSKFNAGRQQYDTIRKSYVDRINKKTGNTDGEDYLTDYGGAFPADTASSAADSAAEKLRRR